MSDNSGAIDRRSLDLEEQAGARTTPPGVRPPPPSDNRSGSRRRRWSGWWLCWCLAVPLPLVGQEQPGSADPVLATVNGEPIRRSEVEFLCELRRIPESARAAAQDRLLEELIDQKLMAQFLRSRRTEATPEELSARIASLRSLIERSGRDPDEVFRKLGLSEETVLRTLALPLAWNHHVRRVVTEEQLQQHFRRRRAQYDGTRLRVSQIVRPLSSQADDADRQAATALLQRLREEILSGQTTFADAARAHSVSPTAAAGGDLGWVAYGTRLPRELSDAAFALKPGEISPPVASRFGVHLLTVTEVQPGDLSLEDVREEVLADLGKQLWDQQLAQERSQAKIERNAP